LLELLEHLHLVPAGVDEDGRVLGGRDVPLQALEGEQLRQLAAGRQDVRVDLRHADLGVRVAAVVRDHQPVEAVGVAMLGLVQHPVLGVRAVLRVDVMVTGEPPEAALRNATSSGAVRMSFRGGGRREHGRRRAGAEQPGAAQETTPGDIGRRQLAVRHAQIESRGYAGSWSVLRMVMVVSHGRSSC
jgi:hypothetical protein